MMESNAIRVAALRRYPVKSMTGEVVDALEIDERGTVGDRMWSVRTAEGKIASGKNTRRFAAVPGMLTLRASLEPEAGVVVTFPDGTRHAIDDRALLPALGDHLRRPVTVARESDVSHFDDGPVSLVGTASIERLEAERGAEVDPVRFRPNIVLSTAEPFVEDAWVGREVAIGSTVLRVVARSPRCVMVDMQTADLPEQHGNLLAVGRLNDTCLGVIATVVTPGRIRVGDIASAR